MRKTNSSSNDLERRLFIVNSLGITWSSLTTPSSFINNFVQVYYESFLIWNIYLTFLYHLLITPFYKNNFLEMYSFSNANRVVRRCFLK